MLDLLLIGLFQAVAGEPAAPSDVPTSSSEEPAPAATPEADTTATPNGAEAPRPRVCRQVVSGQSRLGSNNRRTCNRQSDASRSDHDQDAMRDATARTFAPRDPGG